MLNIVGVQKVDTREIQLGQLFITRIKIIVRARIFQRFRLRHSRQEFSKCGCSD
jgi:hypothetical protein